MMIKRTVASGYMARHRLHWAKPDSPYYDDFFIHAANVDERRKDSFLATIRSLWKDLGAERANPKIISQ